MDRELLHPRTRLELQAVLEVVLGLKNVYFQPPPNLRLKYPCIVYHKETTKTENADNRVWLKNDRYRVTAITMNPDTSLPDDILGSFEMISADRYYTAENLYHYPFTLYL